MNGISLVNSTQKGSAGDIIMHIKVSYNPHVFSFPSYFGRCPLRF